MIIILAILGAFFNCAIRGGLVKKWITGFKGGDIINALAFAVTAGILTNPVIGLLCGVGMFIGSSFSIFEPNSDLALENKDYLWWTQIVIKRGLMWTLPIALVLAPFYQWQALWFILPALLMPVAYSYVWWVHRNGVFNSWSLSEMTFGTILWSCLAVL